MVILNLRKSPNGTLAENRLFVSKSEKYNGTRKILPYFVKTSKWGVEFLFACTGWGRRVDRYENVYWGGQANKKRRPAKNISENPYSSWGQAVPGNLSRYRIVCDGEHLLIQM